MFHLTIMEFKKICKKKSTIIGFVILIAYCVSLLIPNVMREEWTAADETSIQGSSAIQQQKKRYS